MRLCVIPARGGSKRILHKNVRAFCGKPMIAWSIEAALAADCFDQVIVSTDSQHIAKTATEYGAIVPFLRPNRLADDYIGARASLYHAIDHYRSQGAVIDYAAFLYATAPFVTAKRLSEALRHWLAASHRPERAMAVTAFNYPPQRGFTLNASNRIVPPSPQLLASRSQDLPKVYHDAGQFYFVRPDREGLIHQQRFIHPDTYLIELPHYLVQDIDDEDDWFRAEMMFQYFNQQG